MSDNAKQPSVKLAEPLGIDEIHVWPLRYRSEAGRAPLRRVLARYLGCEPEAVALVDDEQGRPGLVQAGVAELRFNWSHSGDRALLAVARSVQPGIDIERQGRRDSTKVLAIARRFFSAAEGEALAALSEPRRERAFLALWTAKEALLKAHGKGLSYGLDKVSVDVGGGVLILQAFDGEEPGHWQLQALDVDHGHAAALAWRGGPMAVRWRVEPD